MYGEFDAVTTTGINEYFFGVASREWTKFTFGDKFMNIDDPIEYDENDEPIIPEPHLADIKFREVTWGPLGSWHVEGALVFLTGATVKNSSGQIVPYTGSDGGYGYFAGIAVNKEGIEGFTEDQKTEIRNKYADDFGVLGREFRSSTVEMDPPPNATRATTYFHLPEEVVCAEGIILVDITDYLWNYDSTVGTPSTYTNVAGTGRQLTFVERISPYPLDTRMNDQIIATESDPMNGNTDGFDLDAIQVYRCIPWRTSDTATGSGKQILKKGTWFMYNYYDGSVSTFDLQAGNPKDGVNIIGSYTVKNNGDGTFTVDYDIDETITKNGYVYDIEVTSEHLGISDTMSFKASPGTDDNQDFGTAFADADGKFYIFAHFAVEYK